MTTDIEKELRELFRQKATDAPAAVPSTADAPQEVMRRGRIHQIGTVVGSAVVAFALVVGSVAGLRALVRGGDTVGGPDDYEVFERTATIEAFTVTSPSDWFLVNQWPRSMQLAVGSGSASRTCTIDPSGNQTCSADVEPIDRVRPQPYGLAVFQLTNWDLGLTALTCGSRLGGTTAVLYVAMDLEAAIGGTQDPVGPWPGVTSDGTEPCGPGRYTRFTVNGEPFFAWAGFGPDVTDEDRATVLETLDSLSVDDTWEPSEPTVSTPAYVIAGGTLSDGSPWRFDVRPGARSPELFLDGVNPSYLGAEEGHGWDSVVPAVPIEFCCVSTDGALDVTFGFVERQAIGVEFRATDAEGNATGQALPGRIVPVPPTLAAEPGTVGPTRDGRIDANLFFVEGTGGLLGEVVPIRPADAPTLSPPPVVEPRAEAVELDGSYDDHDWTARFTGSFAEDMACMQVSLGDEHLERICPSPTNETVAGRLPYLNGWLTSFYLLAGSVPPEVEEIRFVSGNAVVRSQLRCAMGPLGWTNPDRKVCALALPQEGAGTLQYLDAAGTVVFEENIGWSRAEPDVPSEWAVAAGTICGERWSLTRVRSEQGFGLRLDWGTGEMVSAGMSVLGDDALPPHWVPLSGCPDPTDTPSAPEWIVWGLVSRRADAVWLLTDSGKSVEASLATESSEGPFVFWTILNDETLQDELNAAPVGEIVAFDDCEVIGRGSFSTEQQPLPSPAPSIDVAECMPQP